MNFTNNRLACKLILSLVSTLAAISSVVGQNALFTGGSGDGHSSASYKQSQPAGNELFKGGIGDGDDFHAYIQNPTTAANLYNGGIGDGYTGHEYIQNSPTGTALFLGGIGDGADQSTYEQDLTVTFGVYTGGDGDGYAASVYLQSPTPGTAIFMGGSTDGHATSSYLQHIAPGFAIYGGGLGDGHSVEAFLQELNTSSTLYFGGTGDGYDLQAFVQSMPRGNDIYTGGAGDGADQDDYEQGVVAVFGVYTGGEGDGFDMGEYQQPDFIDVLPIELLSFEVALTGRNVEIRWTTATEINNEYFLVERSNDLKAWSAIDSIAGAGNSSVVHKYSSLDQNPKSTINYYRLKQVDYDGTSSYSMIRTVDLNGVKRQAELLVYPNPVRDRINLQLTGFESTELSIKIYDMNGRLIYGKQLLLVEGQGVYEINRATNMLRGYYIVIATDELNGDSQKTRMLVD